MNNLNLLIIFKQFNLQNCYLNITLSEAITKFCEKHLISLEEFEKDVFVNNSQTDPIFCGFKKIENEFEIYNDGLEGPIETIPFSEIEKTLKILKKIKTFKKIISDGKYFKKQN